MRRLILLFSATLLMAAPANPTIDAASLDNFNKHYAEFYRRFYGCPAYGKWSIEMCYPAVGYTDLESWRRAREAAKTLFGLK